MKPFYKFPRLYVETLPDLAAQGAAVLSDGQNHYLRNVMRLGAGDGVRVFHPDAGEYVAYLGDGKKDKTLALADKLRSEFISSRRVHLYATPLQKDRMDFLIEKATELGMTDFHPLLTDHTQIHKVNGDRLAAQVIEAAEQCERLDIPSIHAPVKLAAALESAPGTLFAAIERLDGNADVKSNGDVSIFIGPPGGWSDNEREMLMAKTRALSLGQNVLRAETAALAALVKAVG